MNRFTGLLKPLLILSAFSVLCCFNSCSGPDNNSQQTTSSSGTGQESAEATSISESENGIQNTSEEQTEVSNSDNCMARAKEILDTMTPEEKIAQLFIITPEQLTDNRAGTVIAAGSMTKECIAEKPVGGIIYFSQNLKSREQTESMLEGIQSYSKIPLFLCIDEEGGKVARIANSGLFDVESFSPMGNIKTTTEANYVGKTIGSYLQEIGFNLDFAPDADVNSNPENTVIGTRAFSSDYQEAAELTAACVAGFKQTDTLCTLKHFPGHGDTFEDSHTALATTDKTLEELENGEFLPFTAGIKAGADLVMAGHIEATEIDDKPASVSKVLITDILRNQLGYDGLVVTDAMNMGAITELYDSGEAAVAAIQAGCDLILMPEDYEEAYNAVFNAVKKNNITKERIDESVLRILRKKIESGIIGKDQEE